MDFFEKFTAFVAERKLIKPHDRILVGFSGGADSTALLLALWHLRSRQHLSILAVHINYQLRGGDSAADEEFVKGFCFKRNIALVIKKFDPIPDKNLENTARGMRFAFFREIQKSYKINKIALAHNRSDQAETILFRLCRGSGIQGLRGILPQNEDIIHPLISFPREEIEAYLKSENVSWRTDLTNFNLLQSRNLIRNQIIPTLKDNINPTVIDKIYNTGEIFEEIEDIMEQLADRRLLNARIGHNQNEWKLSIPELQKMKKIIRYYIFKQIIRHLSPCSHDIYLYHFEQLEVIMKSQGSKEISLPNNIRVRKQYDLLIFCPEDQIDDSALESEKILPAIRARLTFDNSRLQMRKLKKIPHPKYIAEFPDSVYLDYDKILFPLTIRHRKPGDKFIPNGMQHHKKLKDFFIDEKIAKFERDRVLIICDAEKIIWIAGYRFDQRAAIDAETKNILHIKIEKLTDKKPRAAERINHK